MLKNPRRIACENFVAALAVLGFESSLREIPPEIGGGESRFVVHVPAAGLTRADRHDLDVVAARAGFLSNVPIDGVIGFFIGARALKRGDALAAVKAQASAAALSIALKPFVNEGASILADTEVVDLCDDVSLAYRDDATGLILANRTYRDDPAMLEDFAAAVVAHCGHDAAIPFVDGYPLARYGAVADALNAVFAPLLGAGLSISACVPATETAPALTVSEVDGSTLGLFGSLDDVALFVFDALSDYGAKGSDVVATKIGRA